MESDRAAAQDRCRGIARAGTHRWKRIYSGATLDIDKCVNVGCGRSRSRDKEVAA